LPRSGSRVRAPSPAPDFLDIIGAYAAPSARVYAFCILGERPGSSELDAPFKKTHSIVWKRAPLRSNFGLSRDPVTANTTVQPNAHHLSDRCQAGNRTFVASKLRSSHPSSLSARTSRVTIQLDCDIMARANWRVEGMPPEQSPARIVQRDALNVATAIRHCWTGRYFSERAFAPGNGEEYLSGLSDRLILLQGLESHQPTI
jgi:hypothetical protein